MNVNELNKKNILNKTLDIIKSNLKYILIFLSLCFILFLVFQIYNFYNLNKIKNNSIIFFELQNTEDIDLIRKPIKDLSNENDFYAILSKLELIQINLKNENIENIKLLYDELLDNKKLNSTYKSAIASKASYQFIDLNFKKLQKDYLETINNFISYIDEELEVYQGIKLELTYLVKILEVKKNKIEYLSFNEALNIYDKIINSEIVSSNIKDRVKKIHEYLSYQ